ncbi:hypothetical protein [Pseudomonas sp. S1(2024)]|uniref:hypothetical protein n=1 Tax=Pseudomonas sp. S1(2024) TaxID=3390191 RepID=UPI00397D9550
MNIRLSRGGAVQNRACDQFESWQRPDVSHLNDSDKEVYIFRYRALEMYSAGSKLSDIEGLTGIAPSQVVSLAKKCLEISPDGNPWGCRALLPRIRLAPYTRSAPPSNGSASGRGGYAGAFGWILDKYEDLPELLRKKIFKIGGRGTVYEHKVSAKTLHSIFLQTLQELGAPIDQWPFTTELMGARTISKFLNAIMDRNFDQAVLVNEESSARAHLKVGKGMHTSLRSSQPYDIVEVDAYKVDCHTSVEFMTPEGLLTAVHITRMWLLAMIDVASTAVISYTLVFKPEVNAEDVVNLFRIALLPNRERPLPLVDGLIYPEGSGLPSEVIEECKGALWSIVKFDGALANLAEKVTDQSRKELGYSWNVGPSQHFERRNSIERKFADFANGIFSRMPSTTGHGPGKGRADKAEQVAVTKRIIADEIRHLLDVEIAMYNALPTEGLYMSPLDYIRQKITNNNNHLILRKLPNAHVQNASEILLRKKRVFVRGGRRTGRAPHIQFARVKYTSEQLRQAASLIGKQIYIEIFEDDIRYLRAFTLQGESLGMLVAMGHWAGMKHSLATRQAINKLVSERVIIIARGQNPVQVYMQYLTTKSKTSRKKSKSPLSTRQATEAKRLSDETGLSLNIHDPIEGAEYPSVLSLDLEAEGHCSFAPMPDLNKLIGKNKLR